MRITTKMIADTAAKTGIPIHQTTLLDVINSEENAGSLLSGVKNNASGLTGLSQSSLLSNRVKKDSYQELENTAESLKTCAEKLRDAGEDSLFAKVAESKDTNELTAEIEKMAAAYNQTLEQLDEVGGAMNHFYAQELEKLAAGNKEALEAVGITQGKDGKLSVDSKLLQSADLESLRRAVGSASDFMSKAAYVSERVSANASANIDSLSSQYNSDGYLFSGLSGTNHFDYWG